jgi:glycosyltransferase involved in cell wall biosynthesis
VQRVTFPEQPRSSLAGATVMQAVASLDDDFVGRSAFNAALALLRTGARAIITSNGGQLVGELQASGGEWMQLPVSGRMSRSRTARQMRELVAAERINLMHAHGFDMGTAMVGAVEGTGTRLLTTYMNAPTRPSAPSWFRRAPVSFGDAVIVPSAFAADFVSRQYSIVRGRMVIIPRIIDTVTFEPARVGPDRIGEMRDAWHADRKRVVFTPGRIAEGKGQLALVEAVRALVNGGMRDVLFVISGSRHSDANRITRLDAAIASHGLRTIIRRTDACEDMPAAYAAASFVCLPGHRSTLFSEVAAEAQVMARPLIACDTGAMREAMLPDAMVGPSRATGWLARPGDPLDLARAIASALALTPEAWRAMCGRSRQFGQWKHAPARAAELTLETYAAMLGPD